MRDRGRWMIQIEGLTKVYGSRSRAVTALLDVSLDLDPGVWGVVGPNGAGKTTLLGLVLGFLRPSDGSVTIDGRAPHRYLRARGAGYLPERFSLPSAWPVRSALRTLARVDGFEGAEAEERVASALDRMDLADHADRPVGELSRGLSQRVGLAQALLARRRLVVLDEPTEGLDPLWRIRFRDLVHGLRDPERTVLLASHDLAEVERLADRVIVLRDGQLGEVMDVRQPPGGPLRFRLSVDAPDARVLAAFPGAAREAGGGGEAAGRPRDGGTTAGGEAPRGGAAGATGDATGGGRFVVTVADAAELSHRLAALLDAGATLHGVVPLTDDLESRVRHRLEET